VPKDLVENNTVKAIKVEEAKVVDLALGFFYNQKD
jgi:hypothetical protein